MKNFIVHAAFFSAGCLGVFFLYQIFVIPGKDASIEAKQNQIEQLNFVKDLASNLTNSYQNLGQSLRGIASSMSNSDAIISHYNDQIIALQLAIKTKEIAITNLTTLLAEQSNSIAHDLDFHKRFDLLGDWGIRIAQLGSAQPLDLSSAGHRALDQPTVGQEVFDRGKTPDVTGFVEDGQTQMFANARHGLQQGVVAGSSPFGQPLEFFFQGGDLLVVVPDHGQVVL